MDREALDRKRTWVTQGPIVKVILALATPIVAARLLAATQESVDAIFLGRVSTEDLAAPAAASPLLWLFAGLGMGINTTLSALVSQAIGARDYASAQRYASKLLGATLMLGAASALAIILAAETVFILQGFQGRSLEVALAYTLVEAVGMPFMLALFYFNAVMAASGDTRTPFKVSALSSMLNVILDPILIFGLILLPPLGAVGAAVATVLARAAAVSIAFYLLLRGAPGFRVKPSMPDRQLIGHILRIGGPVSLQRLVVSIGFLVMMGIVARLGAPVVAAYNVSLVIIHVVQSATFGFNIATATVVGQNLGASNISRAVRAAYTGVALVFGLLSIGALAIVGGRSMLVSLFTSIEEVQFYAERMISIVALGMPFLGAFFTAMGVARGSGRTAFISALGIARLWLLRIPAAYTLVYIYSLGDMGVWLAMTLSNIIAGTLAIAWVAARTWAKPIVKRSPPEPHGEKPPAIPEPTINR
ncbi:MatE efflux family protein [Aeropyrum pernix]|uniref:Multidrug-efflux transporter n=1 Tax=Aeropyrum pernix TaxID=56636 RepID=A0A401HA77_AERPX|nr:MATE family efflux transporter [Aeropyrum pernix]GBF09365.1 MatE efflux family protein [Aeropyrum pernix]